MKILVAIDGSEASLKAVEEVGARQWPPGTTAELLTVVEPSHLWTMSITAEQVIGQARQHADDAAARLPSLNAKGVVMQGDPKSVIVERAKETGAGLVVVGSHGSSAIVRFLLGNVAAHVVRHAPCSVEIVRLPEGRAPGVRKILLATDGSEYSMEAARDIALRPWPNGVQVRVLSVLEYIMPATQVLLEPAFVYTQGEKDLQDEAMRRAQDAVAGAVQILQTAFDDISESVSVLTQSPKNIILEEAEQWGADLIVMGSHGRTGAEHLLMGSVSESVAIHAECSVEVVRRYRL